MITDTDPSLHWVLAALFISLVVGSVARFVALRKADDEKRRKRFASLRTWWLLTIALTAALLAGRFGICVLLATASCIGWFELTRMVGAQGENKLATRAGYGLIIVNYLLILSGSISLFAVFLPIASLIVIAVLLLMRDEPKGYIRASGSLLWGMMFLGYGVSHAAVLMVFPTESPPPVGQAGWFLFLVILTETDDIFQAIVGRMFGARKRHRIARVVSPNKTWEGFFGGLLVIVIVAPVIAPWLTTLGQHAGPLSLPGTLQPWVSPILAAILISFAGFFGDINMSAIKRDAGIKDSSNLLPGMGGVIDRIDSLSMTAPVFLYFVMWWTR
ncbi:MAG TPA: phosphatidate cytidylyltransferase [Anaerolineae bacterium]|nr:phosphatidate cytidylyltransferase [Anaerolineae bacterium]